MLNVKKIYIVLMVNGCFILFDYFVNYDNIVFLNYNLYYVMGEWKYFFIGNDRFLKIYGDKRCFL